MKCENLSRRFGDHALIRAYTKNEEMPNIGPSISAQTSLTESELSLGQVEIFDYFW
jgi:hypothetical protein